MYSYLSGQGFHDRNRLIIQVPLQIDLAMLYQDLQFWFKWLCLGFVFHPLMFVLLAVFGQVAVR